jgi:hypothetical protein
MRLAELLASSLAMYCGLRDTIGTALCLVGLAALAVEATLPQVERAARLSAVDAVLHGTMPTRRQHEARDRRAEYVRVAGGACAALEGDARAQAWRRESGARARAWRRESGALAPAQAMRWAMEQGHTEVSGAGIAGGTEHTAGRSVDSRSHSATSSVMWELHV